jgi:hypothetical protein
MSLNHLDGALVVLLRKMSDDQLRAFMTAAMRAGLEHAGLSDDKLLINAIEGAASAELVAKHAAKLDEEYFRIGELKEKGEASEAEWLAAFSKARAAGAVATYVEGGPLLDLAGDVAYEISAVFGGDAGPLIGLARKHLAAR